MDSDKGNNDDKLLGLKMMIFYINFLKSFKTQLFFWYGG